MVSARPSPMHGRAQYEDVCSFNSAAKFPSSLVQVPFVGRFANESFR